MGSGATRGGDMLRGAVVAAALVAALLRPAVAGQSVLQTDQTVQTVQAQTVQTAAAPAKPLPPLTVDLPDGSGTLRGGQLADLPTGSFQVNFFLGAVTALCLYSILHYYSALLLNGGLYDLVWWDTRGYTSTYQREENCPAASGQLVPRRAVRRATDRRPPLDLASEGQALEGRRGRVPAFYFVLKACIPTPPEIFCIENH